MKKKSEMGLGCFSIDYNLKQNYWNQDSIILTQEQAIDPRNIMQGTEIYISIYETIENYSGIEIQQRKQGF